jgi:hypothetical protein
MENKITYLLGAGASKECLPLVKEIPGALTEFLKEMKNPKYRLSEDIKFEDLGISQSKGQIQRFFWDSMEWLITNTSNHSSIDTFAKKLYITKKTPELIKLKACLAIFFVYTQLKKPVDKRYDSFIASLINPSKWKHNLPSNLRILSWNYDFQFEKAYSFYRNINSLVECQAFLNVSPADITSYNDVFSLYKLNGTTGYYTTTFQDLLNVIDDLSTTPNLNAIEALIKYYAAMTMDKTRYRSMISFAWEDNSISNEVIEQAIRNTSDSQVLIVIGYSFPFFNREIDRRIIGEMKQLKKVYFQAPEQISKNYIDRFSAIRSYSDSLSLIPISDVDQFYLPPEL